MRKVRIIVRMLVLMLLVAVPSTKAFAKKVGADFEHIKDAPEIEIGKEYTIDRDDCYGADLAVKYGETEQDWIFYKFVIPEKGEYKITYKNGGNGNINFILSDENHSFCRSTELNDNAPVMEKVEYLKPYTFYLGVFDSETKDVKNVHASFSIAPVDKPAKDVNYVTSQEIRSNKQTGMTGGLSTFEAERLALSCKYTVGYNDPSGSNVNLSELNKNSYFKFYVEKDGFYLFKWDVESGAGRFGFLDPANRESNVGGLLTWDKTCESLRFIKAGVYYCRVQAATEDFKGSFSITDPTSTIKSITAGKKKLTVKVKKVPYGVEGYRIYYYSKKDRSDQKYVDITGTSGSYTIKKLKSGKKYYVDVTPMIIDRFDIKSFGIASKVKISPKVK